MSTTTTTSAPTPATPITLFGKTYALPETMNEAAVTAAYNGLDPAHREIADRMVEVANQFYALSKESGQDLPSLYERYQAWMKENGAVVDAQGQPIVDAAGNQVQHIPLVGDFFNITKQSSAAAQDAAQALSNLLYVPAHGYGLVTGAFADVSNYISYLASDPAMDAERARRFAVAYAGLYQQEYTRRQSEFLALPDTGIDYTDPTKSRQEAYPAAYTKSEAGGWWNDLKQTGWFSKTLAFVSVALDYCKDFLTACFDKFTGKEATFPNWGEFFAKVDKKQAEIKYNATNSPESSEEFLANVREIHGKEASQASAASVTRFFGKESPEAKLATAATSGGEISTQTPTGHNTSTVSPQGQLTQTGGAPGSNVGETAAAAAADATNYNTTVGALVGTAAIAAGGVATYKVGTGVSQGVAQSLRQAGIFGNQAQRFLNWTGMPVNATPEALRLQSGFMQEWPRNLTRRLSNLITYPSSWAWNGVKELASIPSAVSTAVSASDDLARGAKEARALEAARDAAKGIDAAADSAKVIRAAAKPGLLARFLAPLSKFAKPIPLVGAAGAGFLVMSATADASAAEGSNLSCWDLLDKDLAEGKISAQDHAALRKLQEAFIASGAGGIVTGLATEGSHHALLNGVSPIDPKLIERYLPETTTKTLENLGRAIVPEPVTSGLVGATEWTVSGLSSLNSRYNPFADGVPETLAELAAKGDSTLNKYMDGNLDGKLTSQEISSHLAQYGVLPKDVSELDRDGDGHITSYDIYTAMKEGHRAQGVQQALLAEAQTYEARADAARRAVAGGPSFNQTTAQMGSVVSVPDGAPVKPSEMNTTVGTATGLYGGRLNMDRQITT